VFIKNQSSIPGIILLLLIIIIVPRPGNSANLFPVDGYFKTYSVLIKLPDIEKLQSSFYPDRYLGRVSHRLRLETHTSINNWLSFSAAYDFIPRIQDSYLFENNIFVSELSASDYRAGDIESCLYPSETEKNASFAVFQNLDRLSLTFNTNLADIIVGRQVIAWGSAHAVNPTDILSPFTFQTIDTENRRGVDAVRVRIPVGLMGEFDTGCVFGSQLKNEENAYYMRFRTYIHKIDMTFLLMDFQKNVLAGWDMTGSLGGAGWWVEGSAVWNDVFTDQHDPYDKHYMRISMGMDYSFGSKSYGFLEYHFSSAGADKVSQYIDLRKNFALSEGAVYLLGRQYIIPGAQYQITPLISLAGRCLWNVQDSSLLIAPSIEYNVSQNIYVSGGGFVSLGGNPVVDISSSSGFKMRSEFGSYPNLLYISLQMYY